MKAKNWRTVYGTKLTSLACPAKTDAQCAEMAQAYLDWLSEARGWSTADARAYIDRMDSRTIIAAEHGDNYGTYERKVIHVSAGIVVRAVPCFSREAHWPDGERTIHCRTKVRSEGVMVYWIMHRGRQIDSFLTAARAIERAKQLAA